MKTHELGKALIQLGRLLQAGPNLDLGDAKIEVARTDDVRATSEIAVNLHTLAGLSKIDKGQWASLIEAYEFPISIRPRDASRDILGKILTYLETNPSALDALKKEVTTKPDRASPELMRALSVLLRDTF